MGSKHGEASRPVPLDAAILLAIVFIGCGRLSLGGDTADGRELETGDMTEGMDDILDDPFPDAQEDGLEIDADFVCWAKAYGSAGREWAESVIQNADGTLTVAGLVETGVDAYHLAFVQLDMQGVVLAEREFHGDFVDSALSLDRSGENGLVVAANLMNPDSGTVGAMIARIDPSGTVFWSKIFDGANDDVVRFVQQTLDGGFIVTGYTNTTFREANDFWLFKLDYSGAVLWNRVINGNDMGFADEANCIKETLDSGFIVVGVTYSYFDIPGTSNANLFVIKLDSSGVASWGRVLGNGTYESAGRVVETADGGYLVGGRADSMPALGNPQIFLVKLSSDGDIEWYREYGNERLVEFLSSMIMTRDGGFVLAGLVYNAAGDSDVLVMKLDADGNISWQKTYGGSGDDWAEDVLQAGDGGLVIVGGTETYGAGESDFWVMKTDPSGNITDSCPEDMIRDTHDDPFVFSLTRIDSVGYHEPCEISPVDVEIESLGMESTVDIQCTR